ncbi:hypothetical protein HPB52_022484 [Rhipicephalus sanguineus]|uniref:Uncharacterized protein n=1 Tax=Rhipicephalus sanguineus TaxID=34632 RepID=A0A9D4Q8K4_RHISA|nr:hypothetical protein HPB52_022484 [Rhipicephalus sanguineus]
MDATEVVDASGEAAGGIKEDEQLTIEPVPSTHNSAAKSTSEDTRNENVVSEHGLENPKEKPPDDEDEEAMDSSQTKKRPAPESKSGTTQARQARQVHQLSQQKCPLYKQSFHSIENSPVLLNYAHMHGSKTTRKGAPFGLM